MESETLPPLFRLTPIWCSTFPIHPRCIDDPFYATHSTTVAAPHERRWDFSDPNPRVALLFAGGARRPIGVRVEGSVTFIDTAKHQRRGTVFLRPITAIKAGGQPFDVGVLDGVAVAAELGECGVEVAGVPQHDGIEDETERSKLVFLAFAVALAQLAALTVEDLE